MKASARDDDITETVNKYSDILYRLCLSMLNNFADAEDAVSDTLIKYMNRAPYFKDEEHKKAWLFKICANVCKDKLRFNLRHSYLNLDDMKEVSIEEKDREILYLLLRLPPKYKSVVHLFYIEGYKTAEIAKILDISASAVRKRLEYGRRLLKLEYEREDNL